MKVSVFTDDNNRVILCAPYHPKWPRKARRLGGEFHRGTPVRVDGRYLRDLSRYWTFDGRDLEPVREKVRTFFGTDDSEADRKTTVSVKVAEEHDFGECYDGLYIGPCAIVQKPYFEKPTKIGNDIVFLQGDAIRYSNRKGDCWIEIDGPAHFLIRDIPTGTADLVIAALRQQGDSVSYERRDENGDISARSLGQAQNYLVANMMDRIRQMNDDELSDFLFTRVFRRFRQHAPRAVLQEAKEMGWEEK